MHKKTAASSKGHFGHLTDDLLRHVLSFLPVADALQTCVLDTRWRDHWRRATSLLLIFDQSSFPSSERFKQLAKLFIHLRGNSPLDKCKIVGCLDDEEERTYKNTMLLIEYALKCQHLKILHLERISSKSLKRLCFTNFCFFPEEFHIRIFVPGLISLQLDDHNGLTPSPEYMPSLETAYVCLHNNFYHSCRGNLQDCEYDDCSCHAYPVDQGVLLHGLSNAVNLELIGDTYTELLIYRWDLECCPIFDKLKTLSLSEWFTTIDLLCILQHSPVLEVLTLKLDSTKKLVRATELEEKVEQSFVCSHLKVVNIECRKVDERVHKILKFLSQCGILRDQISITEQ
ncbi:putative F-box/LRR-repeat protein At5g38386 isoform X7 [Triticum aestivum]|uniref:putative F-box/LRR-repeat protein At5g38386 isoform X7 n=1 Tax=Triticum aestivum TaxID=4565 RepID=UPI00084330E2|nr:putative F-box/LRR-repeat protein At5g38386 isoform X7 [Triticum aestivum]